MFIPFTHPSPNSIPPHISCFQTWLCFMFLFYFTFSFPLFYFRSPNPDPDICPILVTLTWSSLILIHSEPHVCSSVWNQHWLSLELLIRTSEPSPAPCAKFKDSRHLVVQHISWSWVLAEPIEPWYTLGPIPAHNNDVEHHDPPTASKCWLLLGLRKIWLINCDIWTSERFTTPIRSNSEAHLRVPI